MQNRQRFLVANWKMRPDSLEEAKLLLRETKKISGKAPRVSIVVCPPAVFLASLAAAASAARLLFGAQNVFHKERGPFTGEISVPMAISAGARYVIVGHSERRALGETNDAVSAKLKTILANDIKAILCVGERERDADGEYLSFLSAEIKASLSGVQRNAVGNLIVAYEPVWAIGRTFRDSLSARELEETVLFIKKTLSDIYNPTVAFNIPILYGGSVEAKNAAELASGAPIDGFLVGHESLKAESFRQIALALNEVSRAKH